ncbi:MAG: DUF4125 family protein [Lachnospiraceae bacterium]|nr:DUF4125 family protein [Lachnospiraceae bacterium]
MGRSIEEIFQKLDKLFAEGEMQQVENYLGEVLDEAIKRDDVAVIIAVTNELIGFYRDTSQYDKSLGYCRQILPYMETHGLRGSIHYATTCLNVANACRAAGEWEASLQFYHQVEEAYRKLLPPEDSLYASYYNNLSLLYQEMGRFEEASLVLKKALEIMEVCQDQIKIATTCSNLAASLLRMGEEEEAERYILRALKIYETEGEDFHYAAALAVMGELLYRKKRYAKAKEYYTKALLEQKKYVGKTEFYYRILDSLEEVKRAMAQEAMAQEAMAADRSFCAGAASTEEEAASPARQMLEDFFLEYGKPMLEEKFPEFLDKIAVGLVGEGSECFGFDDELSQDHDFGPGFCLWITRDTYSLIGKELEKEYARLPLTYKGITRRNMERGKNRVGVCILEDFYTRLIGLERAPDSLEEWAFMEETALAAATNGKVLADPEGIFSRIREELLSYYPEPVWRARIAEKAALMSQYGQYNYGRMMKRMDFVGAEQCRSRFAAATMEMLYALNRTYSPYYKWLYRGLEKLDCFGVRELLLQLTLTPLREREENEALMEQISILVLEKLGEMGFVQKTEDTYLEHYVRQLLEGGRAEHSEGIGNGTDKATNKPDEPADAGEDEITKEDLVKQLVELEWQCFDKVENEGGRADCQNDWNTFFIMRTSQYLTWTSSMIKSYIQDFQNALERGWNLIAEKYGRMMESTVPSRYREMEKNFPALPSKKKEIIEEIVKIQVVWMEEFAANYPKMAANSRSIHSSEDNPHNTSFETYLRGEISTYSDSTLDLYGRFIVAHLQAGKNLTEEIMTNTALAYGYESLRQAEAVL